MHTLKERTTSSAQQRVSRHRRYWRRRADPHQAVPLSTSSARVVTHRLMAREAGDGGTVSDPAPNVDALQRSCARMSANLRRSLGNDGHDALLARAVRRIELEHPVLAQLRPAGVDVSLDSLSASIARHGAPVVASAIEHLIASVVEILSNLIGADMALTLLEYDGPRPSITRPRRTP